MEQTVRIEVAESFEAYWQELIGEKPSGPTALAEVAGEALPIGCFSQNDT